jgi:hypothetical protein
MSTERHVSDERLLDICLNAGHGQDDDRRHVVECAACQVRLAGLEDLLSDTSAVAAAQADAAFTPEKLAKQRARVMHRLEIEAAPGRVITFPSVPAPPRRQRPRPSTRWIAAAAVAGLVIGMLAGHFAHELPQQDLPSAVVSDAAEAQFSAEEELLFQMETAIDGERGVVLGPLDDMTPRVWEVAAQ